MPKYRFQLDCGEEHREEIVECESSDVDTSLDEWIRSHVDARKEELHCMGNRNLSIYPDPKLYKKFETRIEELNRANRGKPKIQYGDKKRALEKAMRMWIDSGEGF